MILSNVFLSTIMVMTASALPHPYLTDSPMNTASTSTTAASSRSSSPRVSGSSSGSVQIVNNLHTAVYLWSTSDSSSEMQTLPSGGGTYTESWQTQSSGGGFSIKMATTKSVASVLQFEYTVSSETLYWDLSSIDLHADSEFVTAGFSATPNDSSCSAASCAAGDTNCAESYQEANDTDTNSCSLSAGITVTLG